MNRRTALRNVVIVAAGAGLLPSCMQESKSVVPLKNISVTGAQEKMLAALTEAIIPSTKNFVGAKELRSHEFVLTMIDDCTSVEDQGKFTEGLKAFDQLSHDKFGQIFSGYTAEQRNSLLADIEKKNGIREDVLMFYGMVKRYTVQSFTSCKEYMTDIRKYKIVPGAGFKGCVPVNKT